MRISIAAALTLIALCACSGSTEPVITSTYALQSVGGSPLPFTVELTVASRLELVDDVVTLSARGQYTETQHYSATSTAAAPNILTVADTGTYTQDGNSVSISTRSSGMLAGTLDSDTLTINSTAGTLLYVKSE